MKIFVSGIISPDSFADNVSFALKSLGHNVFSSQSLKGNSFLNSVILGHIERKINFNGLWNFEKKILSEIRAFKPELFLSVTQNYSPAFLAELATIVPKRVMWWGDPISNDKRMTLLSKEWTAIFIKDFDSVKKFKIVGRPCYFLNEAMNPAWHKPLSQQKNSSIVVAGNYYNYRQAITEFLIEKGYEVELYGSKPPYWALPIIHRIHQRRYITREIKSEIFGEGLACLNSFSFYEGNSLNCRAFEIAGAGGLQLIEYREAVERCFEPGKEVLTFQTQEELCSLIERAKKEPVQMKKIREAGVKRALAEHTYLHRLKEIIKIID